MASTPENAATRLHSISKIDALKTPIFGISSSVVQQMIFTTVLQRSSEISAFVLRINLSGPKVFVNLSSLVELQSDKEIKLDLKSVSRLNPKQTLEDWSKG